MAVVTSASAANTSAANNVNTAVSYIVGMFSTTAPVLTSTRTITLTTDATPHGATGLVLWLIPNSSTIDRSVQILLKKNGVTQATWTKTAAAIANSASDKTCSGGYATPITGTLVTGIDNTATWTAEIIQTGGTAGIWSIRTSNGTAYSHVEITDKLTTLATNDCLIDIHGMTADADVTLKGVLSSGDSTRAPALVVCNNGSSATLANTVGFKVNNSVTLNIDGLVVLGGYSAVRYGTSGSAATGIDWNFSTLTVGTQRGIVDPWGNQFQTEGQKMSWIGYGAYPTVGKVEIANDIAVSATSLTTSSAHGLAINDTFFLTKSDTTGAGDPTVYTVATVPTATTITFSPALATYARKASTAAEPSYLCRTSGYGVKIRGASTDNFLFNLKICSNLVVQGHYLEYPLWSIQRNGGTHALDTGNQGQYLVSHNAVLGSSSLQTSTLNFPSVPPEGAIYEYNNLCFASLGSVPTNGGGTLTVRHNVVYTQPLSGSLTMATGNIIHDNVLQNTNRGFFTLIGSNISYYNNHSWASPSGVILSNCANPDEWHDNYYDKCTAAVQINATAVTLTGIAEDDSFGSEVDNTADFTPASGVLTKWDLISNTGSLIISTVTMLANSIFGSTIRAKDFNDTVGAYYAWYTRGRFINSSDNLELYPSSGTLELAARYKLGTETVSTFKLGLSNQVNIANTAYDAGSYAFPKLRLIYDGSTEVEDTATATFGSLQDLSNVVTLGASSNNSNIYVEITAQSDATSPNNKATHTPPTLNLRKYGYTFQSQTLAIKETTDEKLAVLTTPVTNPYTTEAVAATVAAYTEFTINHATQTVTITADTTLDKLYDYSQYDLTLDANMGYAEWLTTLDGTNFVSTYDIVLNTGVDLTGEGSIDVGSGTFTRTGTATYDGIVITSTNRVVHIKLNGLVSGSVVQIYNNTNSAEIDKSTVSGTTYDYYYTYTADKNIRVRVRYVNGTVGYKPYESDNQTLGNTGFELTIAQEDADVYNTNNFDGSTATEFAMTEGVIRVDVDDLNNVTTFQRLHNWYLYKISTTTHIDDQPDYIQANSSRDYIFDDTLAIKNLDLSNPLYISGANVRNVSGTNAVVDATGGSIFIRGDYPAAAVTEIWSDNSTYGSGTKGEAVQDAADNSSALL